MSGGRNSDDPELPLRIPGREALGKPLPRRFYKGAEAGPATVGNGHAILLDGRPARTPGKRELALPSLALAEAVAGEWAAQEVLIDPARMPLTRLANTAIDGVAGRMREVAADVVKYVGSDLLCYRTDFPDGLAKRQAELWDPPLAWAKERHGIELRIARGIVHVAQPPEVALRLGNAIGVLDPFRLTSLHVMTTLMGSAILALAVLERQLGAETAWQAAHADEDWQIAEWGEDDEAQARRQKRRQEMQAAADMVRLL